MTLQYKNNLLFYKDNKFSLNEILNILNYDLEEKDILISKEDLINNYLDEADNKDKEFIDFINNNFNEPLMDIFTFIKRNNLIISNNDLFNELWSYLKDKKEILITPNLLKFMYNIEDKNIELNLLHVLNYTKKNFIKFLNENKIDFEQINYQDERINNYKYILDDIKNSDKRTLHLKKYILLTIKNFKNLAIIKPNILKDYLNFEEIFHLYNDYVKDYEFNKLKQIKTNEDKKLTIFEYMKINNLIISNNDVFNELWICLKDKKEILITPNLLNFMYKNEIENIAGISGDVFHRKKRHFLEFLNDNKIEYEEINYKNKKINNYEYILNDIKNSNSKTIHLKKYILLTIRNFKNVAMIKSNIVREYYLNLEEIFYLYNDYVKEYEFKKLKEDKNKLEKLKNNELKIKENEIKKIEEEKNNELKIKENEIKKIEELKNKYKKQSLRLKEKLLEVNILKKEQVIYISTSKSYAAQNRFKIGGVENINLLKSRLSTYNSRSAEGDEFYYTTINKVNNYKSFENRFWSVMNNFRDKKNKEIIIMYYRDLEEIFNFIKDNYDEDINYFNKNIKQYLENINTNNKFLIPEPYTSELISCVSIVNGNVKNSTLILGSKEEIEKEIELYFKENIERNNLTIKKKDVNNYLSNKYKINKNETWNLMKNIKIKYNNLNLLYK